MLAKVPNFGTEAGDGKMKETGGKDAAVAKDGRTKLIKGGRDDGVEDGARCRSDPQRLHRGRPFHRDESRAR